MKTLLVIDDEESICLAFRRFFSKRDWNVETCATGKAGLAAYKDKKHDLVFLDVRLPDADGLEVLTQIREVDRDARVIVISAYGSLETVTQAVRGKAFDYLAKPIDLDQAETVACRAVARSRECENERSNGDDTSIVGRSHVMQEVYKRIGLVAQSDSSVLILGQTGTGKELVASAIHVHSERRNGPFVAVNCGALPENLVESELFGYEKGAFTGADMPRAGRFEAADGGTLFLDEIGELPAAVQTKLLRVLDSQFVERLGSVKPIPLNVRILAATNRNLEQEVKAGRFRSDLFYRLNVIHIELPPLRNRREDILPLAQHFIHLLKKDVAMTSEASDFLLAHSWPGNVRELRNAIEHAIVVSGGGAIMAEHLPESITKPVAEESPCIMREHLDAYLEALGHPSSNFYRLALDPLEKRVIEIALDRCRGNQSDASAVLGVHRNTLRTKIRDLGIRR